MSVQLVDAEELREYLDGAISNWRAVKRETDDPNRRLMAAAYVDAFQSVRVSILGELLPE